MYMIFLGKQTCQQIYRMNFDCSMLLFFQNIYILQRSRSNSGRTRLLRSAAFYLTVYKYLKLGAVNEQVLLILTKFTFTAPNNIYATNVTFP